MQEDSLRWPLADFWRCWSVPVMGMLDCLRWQDPDLRFADGRLTMHDRYHDVPTEIFASMCHPRFSENGRCRIQLMLTMSYPMQ